MQFFLKIIISAIVIAAVSEIAKRSSVLAALLISLPITSILALIWLYRDTRDVQAVEKLSSNIFFAVFPSLLFFILLPLLLKAGMKFTPALIVACVGMMFGYAIYVFVLGKFGIKI